MGTKNSLKVKTNRPLLKLNNVLYEYHLSIKRLDLKPIHNYYKPQPSYFKQYRIKEKFNAKFYQILCFFLKIQQIQK